MTAVVETNRIMAKMPAVNSRSSNALISQKVIRCQLTYSRTRSDERELQASDVSLGSTLEPPVYALSHAALKLFLHRSGAGKPRVHAPALPGVPICLPPGGVID
jgi:hypothetical protein